MRILGWVQKIGRGEVLLTEISRNTRKAHEVLEMLQSRGLVNVRRKGRLILVSLSERGLALLGLLEQARQLLATQAPVQLSERSEDREEVLPSFALDNPWFSILAQRGRARVGL